MSDSGGTVDAEALQNRLPAGLTVETSCGDDGAGDGTDGVRVCGYADSAESGPRKKTERRGAAFEVRRDGDLWTATWLCRGSSADCVGVRRVTGVRERCVEWIIERARGAEGAEGE